MPVLSASCSSARRHSQWECSAIERENKTNYLNTAHPKECAPQHLQVIQVNTCSIFSELAGRFNALKSPYLRRFLKSRRNLRRTSEMYSRTGPHCWFYHLNIIQPKKDILTIYLEMVQDDSLTHNSIMQDCFTIRHMS